MKQILPVPPGQSKRYAIKGIASKAVISTRAKRSRETLYLVVAFAVACS
jgi:hypothetical protein